MLAEIKLAPKQRLDRMDNFLRSPAHDPVVRRARVKGVLGVDNAALCVDDFFLKRS